MNKYYITVSARFADRAHYLLNIPSEITKFAYADDGRPLTPSHAKKVERITAYYLEHDISPVFVANEPALNADEPIEAEALIKLNLWTNTGLPRFTMRDVRTQERLNAPSGNGGGRPRKNTL